MVFESVVGAGDFDRDGRRDLLAYQWSFSPEGESLTLRAVRGVDGVELWQHSTDSFYAYAFPAAVGTDADAGVLLVEYDYAFTGVFFAGIDELPVRLSALAGPDGSEVWTRTYEGRIYDAGVGGMAQDIVGEVSAIEAVGNASTDLLVNSLDVSGTVLFTNATVTADVIDGADGAITTSIERPVEDHSEPIALPAGDLDGAPGDDIVFMTVRWGTSDSGYDPSPRSDVAAHGGADGAVLWEQADVAADPYSLITDPGDLTGDGRAELMLSSWWGGRTVLLDGADGEQRWRRRAEHTYPVGDIDGDGNTDVALARHSYGDARFIELITFADTASDSPADPLTGVSSGGMMIAYAEGGFAEEDAVGYVVRIVDADGNRLRSDRATVALPRTETGSSLWFEPVGDVDGDGRVDALAMAVVADLERETVSSKRRMISGGTGERLWSPTLATYAADGTIDGAGDDVLHLRTLKRGLRLTAHDGLDGSVLWSSRVREGSRWSGYEVVDVTGDGRGDVVLTSSFGVSTVLDGRNGVPLWGGGTVPEFVGWSG